MGKYDWLISTTVHNMDGFQPPLFPTLEYDAEYTADLLAQTEAGAFRFPAMGYYAYHQTRHYPMHPEMGGRDLLRETIAACHRRGIKVIPYVPVGHPFWPIEQSDPAYESWWAVGADGKRMGWMHVGYRMNTHICLNSPYRQAINRIVRELVGRYDVDGLYFDGPYPSTGCRCEHCQARYRREMGRGLPDLRPGRITAAAGVDWSDPEVRAYHAWVVGVAMEVLAELNRAIKETKDIPHLAHGANWLQSRWWGLDRHKIVDGLLSEDPEDLQDRLLATMLRRSTGRCYWAYIGGHRKGRYGHVQFPGLDRSYHTICVEEEEVAMEGYGTLAAGGTPIYTGTPHIYYDPSAVPHIRRPFSLARREAALFTSAEPVEFLAMPVSGQTALWYRPGTEPMPYQAYYKGAFDLFAEARVQITPLYEDQCDPERLRRFRAVLLPNFACMSDEQAELFRNYVAEGGSLLATHETSLYLPDGSRRDDFALADVLGVHAGPRGLVDLTDLGLKITAEHPVTRGFAPGRVIPQDFQVLDVVAEDPGQAVGVHYQRNAAGELGPALVARSFGRGKVVYVASGLEAIYWAARFSVVRQLFTNAVDWFAGDTHPYRVEAPPGVMANLMRVHDGLVLHLLNDNGNKNRHVYARQHYVPVHDVRVSVRVPAGREAEEVRLLEGRAPASAARDGDWLRLELPRLGMYEGVHVRLSGAGVGR